MTTSSSFDAIIVGGGLAGAGTAYALAKRSQKVLICEAEPTLAAKASGNAVGLVMPYVATRSSPPGHLYNTGFTFTRSLLTSALAENNLYTECGALQLPATKRLARILTEEEELVGEISAQRISASEGSSISSVAIQTPSFYLPHAGYCRPIDVTHALLDDSKERITVECSRRVVELSWRSSTWTATLQDGTTRMAPCVILCGAYEISHLALTSWVPLEAIRGQTAQCAATPLSASLRTVISYDGYITPTHKELHFVGAHYRHDDMNASPTDADTHEIVSRLYRTLPSLSNVTPQSSRVCFRASTHDRMPYIGKLPNSVGDNLFINAGHGSRGLITAPLGGEIIARTIHGEPLAELVQSAEIVSPDRLTKRFQSRTSSRNQV